MNVHQYIFIIIALCHCLLSYIGEKLQRKNIFILHLSFPISLLSPLSSISWSGFQLLPGAFSFRLNYSCYYFLWDRFAHDILHQFLFESILISLFLKYSLLFSEFMVVIFFENFQHMCCWSKYFLRSLNMLSQSLLAPIHSNEKTVKDLTQSLFVHDKLFLFCW